MQRNVRHDKRKFTIALVRGAEATANNDFRPVYRITKEFAGGHKSFGWSSLPLVQDDKEMKRCKEHSAMFLPHITFNEVPPLVDEMVSQHNMPMWTASPNRSGIVTTINAFKRSIVAEIDCLPGELFIIVPVVPVKQQLLLGNSRSFPKCRKTG